MENTVLYTHEAKQYFQFKYAHKLNNVFYIYVAIKTHIKWRKTDVANQKERFSQNTLTFDTR